MGKVTQFKIKPGYLGGSEQVMKAYSESKAPTEGAELRNSWQKPAPRSVNWVLRALCLGLSLNVH